MSVILFNMSNAYSRGDSNSMVECCATAPDAFVLLLLLLLLLLLHRIKY